MVPVLDESVAVNFYTNPGGRSCSISPILPPSTVKHRSSASAGTGPGVPHPNCRLLTAIGSGSVQSTGGGRRRKECRVVEKGGRCLWVTKDASISR